MKNIIFLTIILLCGCSKNYQIEPNELFIATRNTPYHQNITITGGRVIDQSLEIKINFPEDIGIEIKPIDINAISGYNKLEIKGKPKYTGKFEINISAGFYGEGDDGLNKTYQFIVKK